MRTERRRVADALRLGLNVMVVGEPAALTRSFGLADGGVRLAPDGSDQRYVSGAGVTGVSGLLERVGRACRVKAVSDPSGGVRRVDPIDQLARLAKVLSGSRVRTVAVLDRPPGPIAARLFGGMRDDLWQVPLSWVVAVDPVAAAVLDQPPADAFFSLILGVGPRHPEDLAIMRSTMVETR